MFPSLFSGIKNESLQCNVCEITKHKCVPFPSSNKKSTFHFYLVHINVWGPSPIQNVSGACWFVTFIDDYMFR